MRNNSVLAFSRLRDSTTIFPVDRLLNTFQTKNMKYIAALILTVAPLFSIANDNNLLPLNQTMAQRSNWGDDIGEVAYVGTRCGALLLSLGTYFITNGTKPEDKINGESMRDRAMVVSMASMLLGKLAKLEIEDTQNRTTKFLELYTKIMASNKMISNNVFEKPIFDDLKFCNQHEKNYIKIYEMYNAELDRSSRKK